jgi:chromosome partitioning protein
VTESDDVASRGRAIFQRLRSHGPETSADSEESAPLASASDTESQEMAGPTDVAPSPPAPELGDGTDGAPADAPPEPVRGSLPGLEDLPAVDARLGTSTEAEASADAVAAAVADLPIAEVSGPPAAPVADETPRTPEPEAAPTADLAPTTSFARDLPRVMAVANQKGGVGKTTTAVNLGACLADIGYRVLVVDLDPQGNASTGLGINIRDLQGSMYDVILHDLPIEDCVEATSVRNLFCAPSSLDLAGAEIELVPAFSRELRLKRALADVHDDYDFVLIDCPPSLGLLTVNGLAAATEVVVPIQCEYYALEGLGQLLRNVNLVQRNLNPSLELSAIILVMYDGRTKLADQVVSEVREHFGDKVCRNVVPRTVRLSEAPSFGQPIIAFDASSRGAIAYRELAKEVSGGTPQRAR